jgi:hypothetical protein
MQVLPCPVVLFLLLTGLFGATIFFHAGSSGIGIVAAGLVLDGLSGGDGGESFCEKGLKMVMVPSGCCCRGRLLAGSSLSLSDVGCGTLAN